jgi:hypothetical protein
MHVLLMNQFFEIASKRERRFDLRRPQNQPHQNGLRQRSASTHTHSTVSRPKLIGQLRRANPCKVNWSQAVVRPPLKLKVKIPIGREARGAETAFRTTTSVTHWTCQDVNRWVCATCLEHARPLPFPTDTFLMSGRALLLLGRSDFLARSETCGEILYRDLQKIKKGKRTQISRITLSKKVSFYNVLYVFFYH